MKPAHVLRIASFLSRIAAHEETGILSVSLPSLEDNEELNL